MCASGGFKGLLNQGQSPVGQPAFVAQRARRSPVTNTGTLLTAPPPPTVNGGATTLLGG